MGDGGPWGWSGNDVGAVSRAWVAPEATEKR